MAKVQTLFRNHRYIKNPWEEKETRNFRPVINSMQLLIQYSHKNDDVQNECNYCAESKNVEIPVDQIGHNTKNELFQHKISHTQYFGRPSRQ